VQARRADDAYSQQYSEEAQRRLRAESPEFFDVFLLRDTSRPLKKVPAAASRASPVRRHARRAVLSGQEGRFRRLSVAFLAPTKRALPRDGTFSTAC